MRRFGDRRERARAIRETLAAQLGVIHRSQLRAAGMSDSAIGRAVASGDLERIHPSVYLDGAVSLGWDQALMGAQLWAGEGTWLSHRSAAALLVLDGIEPGAVDVTVTNKRGLPPGIVIHRTSEMPECDVQLTNRFRETNATRTLLELGSVVNTAMLEMALECALRRGLPSIPRLRWRMEEVGGPGRPGTAKLRRLLELRGPRTPAAGSALEVGMIQIVRGSDLPVPERQYRIVHEGRFLARVDLAYPEARVAIEADSIEHHFGLAPWQADLARRSALASAGWLVLHFSDEAMKQPRR